MPDPSFHTTRLNAWLARIRAGDQTAKDELLRSVCDRLERLARKMLRGFPRVARWENTDDVLQNALVRLCRALEAVEPTRTGAFFGLATEQIRRELLDLKKHYYGACGLGANYGSNPALKGADPNLASPDPPASVEPPEKLERWARFHEEVARLPAQEREVVILLFYHGWKQADVAELLQVHSADRATPLEPGPDQTAPAPAGG